MWGNLSLLRIAFLAIGGLAVLAAQPIGAGERPDPTRWEEVIESFEAADESQPPPQNEILFVGSSSIRMWDLGKSFPNLKAINRGFGGSHIADSTHYAPRIIIPYRPRIIVLYAGDNDIARDLTPQQVSDDYRDFVSTIRAELPAAKIIYIAIKPSRKRWRLYPKMVEANRMIANQIKADRLAEYADIATPMLGEDGHPDNRLFIADGLHLNDNGYALWTRVVHPFLMSAAVE